MIYTKNDIARLIANNNNISITKAADNVDDVINAIISVLEDGDTVKIIGFGTFNVIRVPECERVDPRDGSKIIAPARNRAKFKYSPALARRIAFEGKIPKDGE